jgi:hypothetical protein
MLNGRDSARWDGQPRRKLSVAACRAHITMVVVHGRRESSKIYATSSTVGKRSTIEPAKSPLVLRSVTITQRHSVVALSSPRGCSIFPYTRRHQRAAGGSDALVPLLRLAGGVHGALACTRRHLLGSTGSHHAVALSWHFELPTRIHPLHRV